MKTVFTLAAAAMIASCAPQMPTGNSTSNSIQKSWELVSLDGQDVNSSTPVYLDFGNNNKITGKTGCNTVNGTFTVTNGTQVRFSQLASTRMMCAPSDMNIENQVLDVLKTADNFTVNDGKLMLNVGRRAPLAVFTEMSNNPVVNKFWILKEMNGNVVTPSASQEKEQGFMLRSNGKITGFAGCNNFFGSYALSGTSGIAFDENMGMTMKACPDLKINEQAFTGLFREANRYEIKGSTLQLKDANGKTVATFETM